MKADKIMILLFIMFSLAGITFAIPNTINIQGKLTNPSGSILTGTFNFTFRVYDAYTSGNKLYETNLTLSTDSRGIYDIILRDVNITFADQLYLAVKVNNDAEMEPRVNLTSNPSAFRANISDDLNKNNAYTIAGANVTGNLSVGQRLTFALGQFFDNLAGGWLKLTGALNVTSGVSIGGGLNISEDLRVNNQLNITPAGNLVTAGSITSSATVQATTLTDGNVTITGGVVSASQVQVGGGFSAGGMTLLGADIITQGDILFSGNVTVINVSHLSVNGSIVPALDNSFDIGNGSLRWRNANFTGRIEANALTVNGSNLYVDSANGRVGIGTTSPQSKIHIKSPDTSWDGGIRLEATSGSVFKIVHDGTFLIGYDPTGGPAASPRFAIDSNGNIGIGTISPNYLLQVASGTDGRSVNLSNVLFVNGSSGNIGIGTTNPSQKVHIVGGAGEGLKIESNAGSAILKFREKDGTAETHLALRDDANGDYFDIFQGSASALAIKNGNVGIGTTTPPFRLSIAGSVDSSGSGITLNNTNTGQTWALITGEVGVDNSPFIIKDITGGSIRLRIATDGTFTGSATNDISDARLKENITGIDSAIDKIMRIRGIRFTWKKEAKLTDRPQLGVLAQEVEAVFPELVLNTSIVGAGYKSVQYGGLIAPLIEAVKEQQHQIESLKADNDALKAIVCKDHPDEEVCKK